MQENTNTENSNYPEIYEKQNASSEEKYRSIFDIAGDAIFLLDKDTGHILDANQTAVKLYGYEKSEFLMLKNNDLSAEPNKIALVQKTEPDISPVNFHKKNDGTVFPIEMNVTDFEFSEKKVTVLNVRDITSRMIDRKLLEDKNKEMEQLIYIASHDFRSPLLNIAGYSGELKSIYDKIKKTLVNSENHEVISLLNRYFESDIPEAFQYIDQSCAKINNMIDAFLKISRISRSELCYQQINMTEFCTVIASVNNSLLQEKNISVEIKSLPVCMADRNLLNQVFAVLFANSIKFIKKETGGFIKITGTEDNNKIIYCFEDNGVGIPSGKELKIFEVFTKINADIAGEGIGLTIALKIIERHHGIIWVESEEGQGCRFFIQLPKYI